MTVYAIDKLIAETRRVAAEFRRSTGQTLPVSGEIAKYDAARLLDLNACEQRTDGVDATERVDGTGLRYQIKARIIADGKKSGARLGQLNPDGAWDRILLVIMDTDYEPCEIHAADRADILDALGDTAGSRRTNRGALSVAKFKIISELVWTRENGLEETLWTNN
jgi:hypothetical protein